MPTSVTPQAHPALGPLLRATREGVGISRRALALRAGVNHTHLARFESGERAVSKVFVARVIAALTEYTLEKAS